MYIKKIILSHVVHFRHHNNSNSMIFPRVQHIGASVMLSLGIDMLKKITMFQSASLSNAGGVAGFMCYLRAAHVNEMKMEWKRDTVHYMLQPFTYNSIELSICDIHRFQYLFEELVMDFVLTFIR